MKRIMRGIDGLRHLAILKTTPNVEKRMFLFRYLILVSKIEAVFTSKASTIWQITEMNVTQAI